MPLKRRNLELIARLQLKAALEDTPDTGIPTLFTSSCLHTPFYSNPFDQAASNTAARSEMSNEEVHLQRTVCFIGPFTTSGQSG